VTGWEKFIGRQIHLILRFVPKEAAQLPPPSRVPGCQSQGETRPKVDFNIKRQITSFMRPNVKSLSFHVVDVELQTNTSDCGLHALAMATELAYGFDPAVCVCMG
jgi:hypothetical protein